MGRRGVCTSPVANGFALSLGAILRGLHPVFVTTNTVYCLHQGLSEFWSSVGLSLGALFAVGKLRVPGVLAAKVVHGTSAAQLIPNCCIDSKAAPHNTTSRMDMMETG